MIMGWEERPSPGWTPSADGEGAGRYEVYLPADQTLAGEGHEWFVQWEYKVSGSTRDLWAPFDDTENRYIEAAFLAGLFQASTVGRGVSWYRWDFITMEVHRYMDTALGDPQLLQTRDIRRVLVFEYNARH